MTETFDSSVSWNISENTNIIHNFESFDSAPASGRKIAWQVESRKAE